ncbi:MAG: ATP-binding cassette domain-containing protein [Propionibacteriaceae bacterium]|jgi:NitT/TauT family transport system ATP-binding protein|nr:ATP-binding cassette domain-containing protein [Propionibacteriaceae bacterium]
MIQFDHVSVALNRRVVLDDLSFIVPDGATMVVTGSNGSGKSTLIRLALGLLAPDAGRITSTGGLGARPRDERGDHARQRGRPATIPTRRFTQRSAPAADRGGSAAVFQEDRLCEQLTAVGNVAITLDRRISRDSIRTELARAGLSSDAFDRPVRLLSGGQRRRICLVRALMPPAQLICLDEPFTGIDSRSSRQTMAYVRERLSGRATILVTHSPVEAEFFGGSRLNLG